MHPRHRDVAQSYLALVPPSHLEWLAGGSFERDQVHVPVVLLLGDVLEDDVGVAGLGDDQHRVLDVVLDDLLGEGHLADLALELGEVVAVDDALRFLQNFALDPLLEAEQVDQFARALALARGEQKVVLSLLVAQAHLARSLGVVAPGLVLLEVDPHGPVGLGLVLVSVLSDDVFEPPEFYDVAEFEFVASLLSIVVLEASNDNVGLDGFCFLAVVRGSFLFVGEGIVKRINFYASERKVGRCLCSGRWKLCNELLDYRDAGI